MHCHRNFVARFDKDPIATIAPLRHVMRDAWQGHPRPSRNFPSPLPGCR
jgi:hypothetical protein